MCLYVRAGQPHLSSSAFGIRAAERVRALLPRAAVSLIVTQIQVSDSIQHSSDEGIIHRLPLYLMLLLLWSCGC